MGYEADFNGVIVLAAAAADAVWAELTGLDDDNKVSIESSIVTSEDSTMTKVADVICMAIGGEGWFDTSEPAGDGADVEIHVHAHGRFRYAETVLAAVAKHGGTGSIEALGEDGDRWRWRLADGLLYDESARTVYEGDVDTDGWIAQLQMDGGFDRVAVAASEAAAAALIERWSREECSAIPAAPASRPLLVAAGHNPCVVGDRPTRHRVYRVEAAEALTA